MKKTLIFIASIASVAIFLLPHLTSAQTTPVITSYTSEPFLGNYYAIDGFDFGESKGEVIVSGKDQGLTIKSWSDTKIEIAFTDRSTFDVGVANIFFVRTSDGRESQTGSMLIRAHSSTAGAVTSVDNLALRIGRQADIHGSGFGNNGLAEGGEVVVTGTNNKQSIVNWEPSKIRIAIGDVPTRQPITFIVRTSQGGEFVDSTPTEEKVILSNQPLIGVRYYTSEYKYYLDQDEYFFVTGNAFGSLRGTVLNIDLGKELNINEWSDGEVRIFPKQNIENLRMGANRFILKTAEGFASDPFTVTFERKIKPECTSWTYSDWSSCSTNGQKARSVLTSSPTSCTGGSPVLMQSCTYTPSQPTCTTDIWACEEWNSCSPSGIQSRSCTKTFDCPNVQTAAPATDQFCAAPNPAQTAPSQSDEIANQDVIVKSTVKLVCPINERSASQGSGTVIDSIGTILTNKHVIAGTPGCLVGFIDDFDDEPYFGARQIADIIKTSPTQDIAVLRIRNPKNKKLSYVDTTKSVSDFSLGMKIATYGYPALFGTKITYTSGDFGGVEGSYIKTNAILGHGNSGGGAYLKNGTFIGIPSYRNIDGSSSMGYILSINTINAWLGNSSIALSGSNNNQYSRVSVLENIDLNALGSLNLFIPKTDEAGNITAPAQIGFFPDVPEAHPNAIAIEVLRERNIIGGYPDGTFKPENTVNRAELLKILVEGKVGKPNENEHKNCFPDVTTQWFAPYVCYAQSAGWVEGYPNGKFKPEQTVNKVEALKMLINSQGIATTETMSSKPFNDVSTTDWFAKYVAKAKEIAILEETGSVFSPGDGMKRAGISENLYRILVQ